MDIDILKKKEVVADKILEDLDQEFDDLEEEEAKVQAQVDRILALNQGIMIENAINLVSDDDNAISEVGSRTISDDGSRDTPIGDYCFDNLTQI